MVEKQKRFENLVHRVGRGGGGQLAQILGRYVHQQNKRVVP